MLVNYHKYSRKLPKLNKASYFCNMKSAKKTGSNSLCPRKKKAEFMLNEDEFNLVNFYLKKYKISNRSRWFRETIVSHILKSLDKDYPTLFDENEMRR